MQIIHCDLALRNVMVNKFPWEVKVAEFGLARDLTRMASRRSSRWRNPRVRLQHAHTSISLNRLFLYFYVQHPVLTVLVLLNSFAAHFQIHWSYLWMIRSCFVPSENPKWPKRFQLCSRAVVSLWHECMFQVLQKCFLSNMCTHLYSGENQRVRCCLRIFGV